MRVYIRGSLQLQYYVLFMLKGLAIGFGFVSVSLLILQSPEQYYFALIPFLASLLWYELVHRKVRKMERAYLLIARGRKARYERMQSFYADKVKKYGTLTPVQDIPLRTYHDYAIKLRDLCKKADEKHSLNLSKEFKARFAFNEKKEAEENIPYVKA